MGESVRMELLFGRLIDSYKERKERQGGNSINDVICLVLFI